MNVKITKERMEIVYLAALERFKEVDLDTFGATVMTILETTIPDRQLQAQEQNSTEPRTQMAIVFSMGMMVGMQMWANAEELEGGKDVN